MNEILCILYICLQHSRLAFEKVIYLMTYVKILTYLLKKCVLKLVEKKMYKKINKRSFSRSEICLFWHAIATPFYVQGSR